MKLTGSKLITIEGWSYKKLTYLFIGKFLLILLSAAAPLFPNVLVITSAVLVFSFDLPNMTFESESVEPALLLRFDVEGWLTTGAPNFCPTWKYLYFNDWKEQFF